MNLFQITKVKILHMFQNVSLSCEDGEEDKKATKLDLEGRFEVDKDGQNVKIKEGKDVIKTKNADGKEVKYKITMDGKKVNATLQGVEENNDEQLLGEFQLDEKTKKMEYKPNEKAGISTEEFQLGGAGIVCWITEHKMISLGIGLFSVAAITLGLWFFINSQQDDSKQEKQKIPA